MKEKYPSQKKGDPEIKKVFKGGGYSVRMAARSWFGFRNVSGQKLTSLGIGSELYQKNKIRAQTKLSSEQRKAVMAELHKRIQGNWTSDNKKTSIPFGDKPELAAAIEIYPKVAYYIGIRADSAFKSEWQLQETKNERQDRTAYSGVTVGLSQPLDYFKKGEEIIIRHLDKGKHGGIAWDKRIFGEFAEEFFNYWVRQGKPRQGYIFAGLTDNDARAILRDCYKAANIPRLIWDSTPDEGGVRGHAMPLHIWRHTAAQDLLDATDWNADLVAATLGWESTQVLKSNYGAMPPDVQRRLVMKAQGFEVPEEKKYFIF